MTSQPNAQFAPILCHVWISWPAEHVPQRTSCFMTRKHTPSVTPNCLLKSASYFYISHYIICKEMKKPPGCLEPPSDGTELALLWAQRLRSDVWSNPVTADPGPRRAHLFSDTQDHMCVFVLFPHHLLILGRMKLQTRAELSPQHGRRKPADAAHLHKHVAVIHVFQRKNKEK